MADKIFAAPMRNVLPVSHDTRTRFAINRLREIFRRMATGNLRLLRTTAKPKCDKTSQSQRREKRRFVSCSALNARPRNVRDETRPER